MRQPIQNSWSQSKHSNCWNPSVVYCESNFDFTRRHKFQHLSSSTTCPMVFCFGEESKIKCLWLANFIRPMPLQASDCCLSAAHRQKTYVPVTQASAEYLALSLSTSQPVVPMALWFFKGTKRFNYSANLTESYLPPI